LLRSYSLHVGGTNPAQGAARAPYAEISNDKRKKFCQQGAKGSWFLNFFKKS